MKRIPLSAEDQKHLKSLFDDYREKREKSYELSKDAHEIGQEILAIFNAHNIEQKEYDNKIFKKYIQIKYQYNTMIMQAIRRSRQTKKTERENIKMIDK